MNSLFKTLIGFVALAIVIPFFSIVILFMFLVLGFCVLSVTMVIFTQLFGAKFYLKVDNKRVGYFKFFKYYDIS
jgi:hypothetical protein